MYPDCTVTTIHRVVHFKVEDENDSYNVNLIIDGNETGFFSLPFSKSVKEMILEKIEKSDYNKITFLKTKINENHYSKD